MIRPIEVQAYAIGDAADIATDESIRQAPQQAWGIVYRVIAYRNNHQRVPGSVWRCTEHPGAVTCEHISNLITRLQATGEMEVIPPWYSHEHSPKGD